MQSFFETFSMHVSRDDTLILAVSGWVDSMVLLDLVMQVHPKDQLIVAHVDHSLRWEESDGDREFVANICKKHDILYEIKKIDIKKFAKEKKMSIEAIARQIRYDFFEELRTKHHAIYIVTAHHADDQAETIILNLIKWWKIHGLSGMEIMSGNIFRPLLFLSKSDIVTYAQAQDISFREDSTNTDTSYERNKLRHEILPTLRTINPSIHQTISELARYMQDISKYIEEQVISWLQKSERISWKEGSFLISDFVESSGYFQWEILSYLYRTAHNGSSQWLSKGLIWELKRFILEGSNSSGEKIIKNLHLMRKGERIFY